MELLNRIEVQQRLQLTDAQLDTAVSDGHLTEFRLGEKVRYHKSEVEALSELFSIGQP